VKRENSEFFYKNHKKNKKTGKVRKNFNWKKKILQDVLNFFKKNKKICKN